MVMCASCGTDPLIHHGRHFGRTVHALCTISALLNNGILRMGELAEQPQSAFTHEYVLSFLSGKQTHCSMHQGASRTSDISTTSSDDTWARRPSHEWLL